jgi:hypothetical protein
VGNTPREGNKEDSYMTYNGTPYYPPEYDIDDDSENLPAAQFSHTNRRMTMKIETKYSLGDKVWKINQEMPKVWEPCTFCEGREAPAGAFADPTEIVGIDGTKRRCPECIGDGGHHRRHKLAWNVTGELTVGQVNYRHSDVETDETYMCVETGVGGGSIHYVDTLYPTKKEAQAECDRRNSAE